MQIITDASGKIIAMLPAENEPVARPKVALAPGNIGNLPQIPNATAVLVPRAGQILHVVPWLDELTGMALSQIHTTYRVVVQGGTSQLERIAKPSNSTT